MWPAQIRRAQPGFDMRDHGIAGERIDLAASGDLEAELFLDLERSRVVGEDAGMQGGFRHAPEEPLDRRIGGFARSDPCPSRNRFSQ